MSNLKNILHSIFFITFVIVNLIIFFYLKLYVNNKCECANDKVWGLMQPLDYIIWFSLAAAGVGLINIFVHINQGISSIPLIGTFFNFGVAIVCLIQVAMISVFLKRVDSQQCKDSSSCNDKTLQSVNKIISSVGLFIYLAAFILAILIVWL
jgi:hypothetical protein